MNLEFTSDCKPGIRRVRRGRQFNYFHPGGRRVADPALLSRIRKLAIPPAYRDVWICCDPRGHLQATGRDARGRKQYRYHADWRTHRDAAKFDRMLEFGRSLARIRRRVSQDLHKPGLPREKVLATLVRLLECTLIRIGNEEYARENGSFGLTTLRDRHVTIRGSKLTFEFRGKSGVAHSVSVNDPHIARIVQRCADIPGQELFQWVDEDGERRGIDSADVNDYLREASGGPFTAKDFRTWFATVEALQALRKRPVGNKGEIKKELVTTIAAVARRLGNTPTICRKSYIHPEVLAAFADGRLSRLNGAKPAAALRSLLRRRSISATLRASIELATKSAGQRTPTH
ncbi:MAG: DNA topoisomerase IB [Proteobacteria bacterium]|nr:DNA topoisomerase IB [Pseudomonadota bacterium]